MFDSRRSLSGVRSHKYFWLGSQEIQFLLCVSASYESLDVEEGHEVKINYCFVCAAGETEEEVLLLLQEPGD